MNITMKRQDIIDKLNELMPAFKAEDNPFVYSEPGRSPL